MSRKSFHKLALVLLVAGIVKSLHFKARKMADDPEFKHWAKRWHHPHGHKFHKRKPFGGWKGPFEGNGEDAEADGAEAAA